MKRLVLLLVVALLLGPVTAPVAGALEVVPSKYLGNGGWGALSGQGSEPFGTVGFNDGDLVYDSQVTLDILYAGPPTDVPVTVEQYTPGTETVYENVTQPNGTSIVQPVVVPVRLDPSWSNLTVSIGGVAHVTQSVHLPGANVERSLLVTVGLATWHLYHLTPASAFLVGSLTVGEQLIADWWQTLLSISVFGLAFIPARNLARRLGRSPKVPRWWVALWVLPVAAAFALEYVPTNQFFGEVSPLLLPFVVTAAAFPYMPRLFTTAEDTLYYSAELRGPSEVSIPNAALWTNYRTSRPHLAPINWRSAFWAWLGNPLPELPAERIKWKGQEIARPGVSFVGVEETAELGSDARSGFDRYVFFRSGTRLSVRFPRLEYWREETEQRIEGSGPGAEGRKVTVTKRKFRPHVEPGSFSADLLGAEHFDAASFVSGLRDRVERASEQERDRLKLYVLQGQIWRLEREASEVAEEVLYRSEHGQERALADEELIEEVLAGHPGRGRQIGGEGDGVRRRDHRGDSR